MYFPEFLRAIIWQKKKKKGKKKKKKWSIHLQMNSLAYEKVHV